MLSVIWLHSLEFCPNVSSNRQCHGEAIYYLPRFVLKINSVCSDHFTSRMVYNAVFNEVGIRCDAVDSFTHRGKSAGLGWHYCAFYVE